jgi:processive 1,2-diacylglycerol beta-glucosyltransferase
MTRAADAPFEGTADEAVRVLVLTAPVAEGHVAAARVLAEDVRRVNERAEVLVVDALPALPRLMRWLLFDAYRWQLNTAPWLFAALFRSLEHSRTLRWLSRALLSLTCSRGLMRVVRRNPSDVIVSTWPAATMILGALRLRGKVVVPVCTTITDFAGLELWADRGVDLHLVMHESLVPVVERVAGRGSAHVVSPLVSSRFRSSPSVVEARETLGLPSDRTIVVVSGGGWGVGDLAGAVEAALDIDAFVVCLAGRDDATRVRLERAFASEPSVRVLGFTEQMSELLVAADVLVHSTGGVTCLEALTCGCPVVAYGAPPGHAPSLARAMCALGLADHARSRSELGAALVAAMRNPIAVLEQRVDAAQLVLRAAPRVAISARARLARMGAVTCALSVALFGFLASDATYPVVAEALALPEATSLPTTRDSVALVVTGQRHDLLRFAPLARRQQLHLSVATPDSLTPADIATLRAAHLDPLPELHAHGVESWFEARRQLKSQLESYGVHGRFDYLAPREGFTIVGYVLGRELGGTPIRAEEDLLRGDDDPTQVRAGSVFVATLDSSRGHTRGRLLAQIRRLASTGATVASVQQLTAARTSS